MDSHTGTPIENPDKHVLLCNFDKRFLSIPKEILAKTLQQLAKLEIIHAIKGPRGGYKVKESLK